MIVPLAHAGHWITSVVYFVPVVGFLVWLGITQYKDKRRGEDDEGETS